MSQRELLTTSILLGVTGTMALVSLSWEQWHAFAISALLTVLLLIGMIIKSDGPTPPQGAGSA
jgi:hypothetical protein